MQVPQHFDVSLTPSATTTISVMQGDGLRLLVAHLKKDAEPWPVPEGISAGLSYERPDRAPGYYDQMNDGTPACVINGDQISVLLDPMLTECPGPVRASIILRDPDGIQVATFPFHILVEQVPGLVHAENMRVAVHRFDGKIYYGGVAGIPQPLGLGNGVQVEKQKDGSLLLVADGNTPVRGVDYWTPADQEAIVQQVIAALGTPVFGRVDENCKITLTGELATGKTYTFVYEDAEGNVIDIGKISMLAETVVEFNWERGVKYAADGTVSTDEYYHISQTFPLDTDTQYILAPYSGNRFSVRAIYYDADGNFLSRVKLNSETYNGDMNDATIDIVGPLTIDNTSFAGAASFAFNTYCPTNSPAFVTRVQMTCVRR